MSNTLFQVGVKNLSPLVTHLVEKFAPFSYAPGHEQFYLIEINLIFVFIQNTSPYCVENRLSFVYA